MQHFEIVTKNFQGNGERHFGNLNDRATSIMSFLSNASEIMMYGYKSLCGGKFHLLLLDSFQSKPCGVIQARKTLVFEGGQIAKRKLQAHTEWKHMQVAKNHKFFEREKNGNKRSDYLCFSS